MELPQMLWMLDPVLAQAQATEDKRQHILDQLAEMRRQANQPFASEAQDNQAPPPALSAVEAINELGRQADINIMLQNHATRMNALTTNWMNAMNPYR